MDDVRNTFPDFTVACLLTSENLAVGLEVRTQAEQSFENLVFYCFTFFFQSHERDSKSFNATNHISIRFILSTGFK